MKRLTPHLIVLLLFIVVDSQMSFSQFDSLKKDIKAIGALFKKAGIVMITVNGIENGDQNLGLLKQDLQKIAGVRKIEDNHQKDISVLAVTYKGKGSDLWQAVPQKMKQLFKLTAANDSAINLTYIHPPASNSTVATNTSENKPLNTNGTTEAASKPVASNLSPGARLLFKNVKTTLNDEQKSSIFNSTGFKISRDKTQFIPDEEAADFPFAAFVYPTDFNKDGKEEIFVVFGNSYTSGNTGSSVIVFIADSKGIYNMNLGFPGVTPDALTTGNGGYPDLLIGGPGFEYPVWRWNGKVYDYYKTVKDADYEKLKKTSIDEASKMYTASL